MDAVVGLQGQWYTFEVVSFVAEVLCASAGCEAPEVGGEQFDGAMTDWHRDEFLCYFREQECICY